MSYLAHSNNSTPTPSLRTVVGVAGRWLLPLLCLLPFISGLPLIVGSGERSALLHISNLVAPITMMFAMFIAAATTVRRYPVSIWTPYIAFLVGSGLFFGLGPLVYVFGNPLTIAQLAATKLSVSDTELARTSLLVALGVVSALIGVLVYAFAFQGVGKSLRRSSEYSLPLPAIAVLFLSIGGFLRYGLILPNQFRITEFVIPGVISNSSNLFALGLAVAGYLSVQRRGLWSFVFWIAFIPNEFVAILELSKTSAMMNLVVPVLGRYLAHRRLSPMFGWIGVAAILFAFMQPLVSYGRAVIFQETGDINRANIARRVDIVADYIAGARPPAAAEQSQSAWTRLAYSGPQAAAMNLHDHGINGLSLRHAWMYFVPRLLWPNKPVLLGPGAEFNQIVFGWSGSFLGLSIYGDAYWQAGWFGVLFFSLIVGFLFGWLSQNSLHWMSRRNLIYLPPVLLAFEIGMLGPTQFLVNGIIGPIPIYLAYLVIVQMALRVKFGSGITSGRKGWQ